MAPPAGGPEDAVMSTRPSVNAPCAPVLTAAAARSIAAEVARLRASMEQEFTHRRREALSVAPGDGDAHWAIGEDEVVVRARIGHLEALLHQATIVDQQGGSDDVVSLGARVTLEDVATGRRHEYTLVAWNDGGAGSVSAASPVGQAIMGRAVDDEATITLPAGRSRRLRIAAVEPPAQPLL
jgi:transcription elongation GreA/GreB family factor